MNKIQNLKTKELPLNDQPYEKCYKYGPERLTESELLAVILKNGFKGTNSIELSKIILARCNDLYGLMSMNINDLSKINSNPEIVANKGVLKS